MSLRAKIEALKELATALEDSSAIRDRVTIVAAKAVEAEFKDRIFVRGEDVDGAQIGSYGTNPFYASSSMLTGLPKAGFSPKGKNGKSKFKNGNKKKSRYLAGGYVEFRDRAGRQSQNVDLNLTGSSLQTIQVGTSGEDIVLGFTNADRQQILEGNEIKFGKTIFQLSDSESELFAQTATEELLAILQE